MVVVIVVLVVFQSGLLCFALLCSALLRFTASRIQTMPKGVCVLILFLVFFGFFVPGGPCTVSAS